MPMFSSIADQIATPEDPTSSLARAVTLRSLMDQRKQQRELGAQQLADRKAAAAEKRKADALNTATQAVFAAGGTPDEVAAKLYKVNPGAAYKFETDQRANKKAELENQMNQLKVQTGAMEQLGQIANSITDEPSYHRGIGKALELGHIKPQEAVQLLAQPWGPDVQQQVKGWQNSAMSAKEYQAAHAKELADAIAAEEHKAKLPGFVADSAMKTEQAAQMAKPVLDEQGNPTGATQGMTDKERQQLDLRAAEVRKLNTPAELAAVASDPTKTDQERKTAKDALSILEKHAIASRPVHVTAGGAGDVLTPDDYKRAGTEYAITGVMPQLGNGSGPVKQRLIHEKMEFARNSGLGPRDMALAGAAFKGDSKSLAAFQTQRDQIVSFEQTAQKNIDLFLQAAAKIPDTGMPWINSPLRQVDEKMAGSANMAAVNAARQIATNEIAKVTSGGGLGGVLSDSARHEVDAYNPKDATFKQTLAIVKVLKQDMANRHTSMDNTLNAIRDRVGTFGGALPGAAAPETKPDSGRKKDPMGIR